MLKYLSFIIIITCSNAIAGEHCKYNDIYELSYNIDQSYVRCSDHISISYDNDCILQSIKLIDTQYNKILTKYSSEPKLLVQLKEYYTYWYEATKLLPSEVNSLNKISDRISHLTKIRQSINNMLDELCK